MTVKTNVSRRTVLKSAGAAALAAPLYSKSALASSGEINILMWSDYLPPEFIA
ncbi:MAG: spermidine/putrescine ABC transporter substrate-binding protein, partial [Leisingera sp.]